MNKQTFWQMFTQTGEPMAYVLYRGTAGGAEEQHARENGIGNRQEEASCSI